MSSINNVIITGASSGIGYQLAHVYASPHTKLGLIGRDKERLNQCVSECVQKSALVDSLVCDVRNDTVLKDWILNFDSTNPVDLIIANSGIINAEVSSCEFEELSIVKDIFEVNFYGTLNTVMPLLNKMIERQRGHIAIMCSLSAYYGLPVSPAYSMSKASLLVYFQALREQLKRNGIILSIICPGYIDTPMTEQLPISKPFMLNPHKAAMIIKKGIEKEKRLVAFPFLMKLAMKIIQIIPPVFADKILYKLCSPRPK